MFPSATISNSTSISEDASVSTETKAHDHFNNLSPLFAPISPHPKPKIKRSQAGNPDPEAEVVALSPKSLLATNRFVCEICAKGFQRDQNLQLHRRGHNLPWRLRQRNNGKEAVKKRVYVCPEPSCVHHHPSRALGDLTGIKKHFCRKHGEKKWKCEKCSKKYAVYSDWKAHVKTCGTREYRCDCGTLFSRKDSFITHRAFCDALAEESARLIANSDPVTINNTLTPPLLHNPLLPSFANSWNPSYNSNPNLVTFLPMPNPNSIPTTSSFELNPGDSFQPFVNPYFSSHHLHPSAAASASAAAAQQHLSATALLQRASNIGHMRLTNGGVDYDARAFSASQSADRLTHDFLGVDSSDVAVEEFLPLPGIGMDVVTTGPCVDDSGDGDHTKPIVGFAFPRVTGAWGDHRGVRD
ncbi:hypothetical protein M5K25_005540 [Dendrobium thyrsiflorum]|uniref:Protein EARLY HEADING DATE 2 n=1 Tax=Dendrobium thyrsiflorum TaxID=117978 RepID=A0ABD0VI46_DENTH